MRKCTYLTLILILLGYPAFGAPGQLTYQGRILKSDGTPLEYGNVSFLFEITNPAGNCVIYREQKNGVNMSGSSGVFDVPIGSGTKLFPTSPTVGLLEIFDNTQTLDCGDANNNVASSYTPSTSHSRLLYVQFHDGTGWKKILPETEIRTVPYAAYAASAESANTLSGKTAADFIAKITIPTCPANTFLTYSSSTFTCAGVSGAAGGTVTDVTSANSYLTIANGTTTPTLTVNVGTAANTVAAGNDSRFGNALKIQGITVDSTAPTSGQVLKYDGTKWALAADAANVGTAGTYYKVTTDAQGRVTSGSTSLAATDIPSLDFSKITSGLPTTLAGYGITDAVKNLGGTPGFKSGANASKGSAGTAGNIYISTDTKEIYRDNGSTWDLVGSAAGSGGTITSVTAGTGLTGGGSSGAVSLAIDAGTTANKIVQLDSSAKLPAVDGSALTNLNPSALSAAVPITKGGTGQTTATAGFNALSPLTTKGDILTRDSSNNIRLGVGIDGQVLSADSSQTSGLKWVTPTNGTVTTVSAASPLSVSNGSTTPSISISSGSGAAQVLRWNSTNWAASYFNFTDLKSAAGLTQIPSSCTNSQTLVWQSASDTFACTDILVSGSNFASQSAGVVLAGPTSGSSTPTFRALASTDLPSGTLSGSGTAGYMPYYSAATTLANSPLYVSSGKVGIGTTSPSYPLDIASGSVGDYTKASISTNGSIRLGGFDYASATGRGQLLAKVYDGTDTLNGYIYFTTPSAAGGAVAFRDNNQTNYAYMQLVNTDGRLRFATNYIERMSILQTGNIGLGTTTPKSALDIAATTDSTASYAYTSGISYNGTLNYVTGATNLFGFTSNPTFNIPSGTTASLVAGIYAQGLTQTGTGTITKATSLYLNPPTIGTSNYAIWSNAGTNYFGGYVGIGSSSPTSKLMIKGSTFVDSTIRLQRDDASGLGPGLNFSTSNGSQGTAGTQTVAGTALGQINFQGTDSTGALVQLNSAGIRGYAAETSSTSAAGGYLTFVTTAIGGTTESERMRIADTGYVGIGVTSPSSQLDVGGTIHIGNSGSFVLQAKSATPNDPGDIVFHNNDGTERSRIHSGTSATGEIYFNTGTTTTTRVMINTSGYLGVGTAGPTALLHVNGSALATAWNTSSDMRLKEQIQEIQNPLDKVLKLRAVEFDWRRDVKQPTEHEQKHDIGIIAQEVEKVFPEAVTTAKDGYKSVAYSKLVSPLIGAVKKLYEKITGVEDKVQKLELANTSMNREIASLKEQNTLLKKALCKRDKELEFCK